MKLSYGVFFYFMGAVLLQYAKTEVFYDNQRNIHIGYLIMATGKYIQFVPPLIRSARTYFCKLHDVHFFVFTDQLLPAEADTTIIYQQRLGWPYDTLKRFHVYAAHKELYNNYQFLFASDADMLFCSQVGDEVLQPLVAVQHPGFVKKRGSYESNRISTACVLANEGRCYCAGGFYGGSTDAFLQLIETCKKQIDVDLEKKYIAVWHDESHLNRYFIDHKPTVVLPMLYCVPEEFLTKFADAKLIALKKKHIEIRR
jgi:histo-blood group ABO system transferase